MYVYFIIILFICLKTQVHLLFLKSKLRLCDLDVIFFLHRYIVYFFFIVINFISKCDQTRQARIPIASDGITTNTYVVCMYVCGSFHLVDVSVRYCESARMTMNRYWRHSVTNDKDKHQSTNPCKHTPFGHLRFSVYVFIHCPLIPNQVVFRDDSSLVTVAVSRQRVLSLSK